MELKQIDETRWQIPQSDGMTVPGIVFASEPLIVKAIEDRALQQAATNWSVALVSGAPFIFAGAMFLVAEGLGEPAHHHNAITRA